jgi:phytol kinase
MRSFLVNGAGLAASFLLVLGLIGLTGLLRRRGMLDAFAARKVIHIGAVNWWFLAMAVFDDPWVASVGPVFSLLGALLSPGRSPVPPGAEADGRKRDRGMILYSLSLLVLVNLSWRSVMPIWIAGIGALVMGWGDGLAGIVGRWLGGTGIRIWGRRKTPAGTVTMFGASLAVTVAMTLAFGTRPLGVSLAASAVGTAAAATALELLTPFGMDNLTIPLGTAVVAAGLLS